MKHKLFAGRLLPAALLLVLAVMGCSRYGDDVTTSETHVVATIRDESTNFSSLTKTFAIVDKINIVEDANDVIDSVEFWNRYNGPVLGAIVNNLTALGYTEVNSNQNPSLFINVTANASVTVSGGSYYPGWWWGYYPCYPYYSWWCSGGWYPSSVYVYSFTEGALVVEMVDVNRSMDANKAIIVWLAGLTSVVSDSPSANVDQAVDDINQAFKQSPYLR
jgi:hypothetical protein